jgi:DNA-binding MarR family transcriptional regulator
LSGRGLESKIKLIESFRKYDPWVGAQTIFAFLYIAQRTYFSAEDVRVMDVGIEMDTTSASASRNMAWLVKHDLIELYENPDKRIEKFIKLTKHGEHLAKKLEGL